ncbi:MFS transporter [Aquabacterium sp.]|uniref:MFS transporter n=1 Tax=Aquabacterium sp. TaxID=1872578 RepID=UPI0024873274|nr:MFS transporter [Aquabacterium sp.]MDI1261531.1 MFS transporter [Aquabacterium sp.]
MTHRNIIWLAAFWQFIYMVDFVMPLPLGPALSRELGFAAPNVAWLSVSYTLASLLSGLGASLIVDRLGKKRVILGGLTCFVLANMATAFVNDLMGLLCCRALAAIAGAPVVATMMAEVIDRAPSDQRGRAISAAMSGASLAVILGVPMALGVANLAGWRAAFVLMSILSCTLLILVWRMKMGVHAVGDTSGLAAWRQLWALPGVRRAFLLQGLSQFSTFLIIPVLATFLVTNLRVSPGLIPWVYASGGLAAFACMRLSGMGADRLGYRTPFMLACFALIAAMLLFAWGVPSDHPLLAATVFTLFMAANAAKNVALASHTAGAPPPGMRAVFMNAQGSMQDVAILVGSMGSLVLLSQSSPEAPMEGMWSLMSLAVIAVLALIIVDVQGRRRAMACTRARDLDPLA